MNVLMSPELDTETTESECDMSDQFNNNPIITLAQVSLERNTNNDQCMLEHSQNNPLNQSLMQNSNTSQMQTLKHNVEQTTANVSSLHHKTRGDTVITIDPPEYTKSGEICNSFKYKSNCSPKCVSSRTKDLKKKKNLNSDTDKNTTSSESDDCYPTITYESEDSDPPKQKSINKKCFQLVLNKKANNIKHNKVKKSTNSKVSGNQKVRSLNINTDQMDDYVQTKHGSIGPPRSTESSPQTKYKQPKIAQDTIMQFKNSKKQIETQEKSMLKVKPISDSDIESSRYSSSEFDSDNEAYEANDLKTKLIQKQHSSYNKSNKNSNKTPKEKAPISKDTVDGNVNTHRKLNHNSNNHVTVVNSKKQKNDIDNNPMQTYTTDYATASSDTEVLETVKISDNNKNLDCERNYNINFPSLNQNNTPNKPQQNTNTTEKQSYANIAKNNSIPQVNVNRKFLKSNTSSTYKKNMDSDTEINSDPNYMMIDLMEQSTVYTQMQSHNSNDAEIFNTQNFDEEQYNGLTYRFNQTIPNNLLKSLAYYSSDKSLILAVTDSNCSLIKFPFDDLCNMIKNSNIADTIYKISNHPNDRYIAIEFTSWANRNVFKDTHKTLNNLFICYIDLNRANALSGRIKNCIHGLDENRLQEILSPFGKVNRFKYLPQDKAGLQIFSNIASFELHLKQGSNPSDIPTVVKCMGQPMILTFFGIRPQCFYCGLRTHLISDCVARFCELCGIKKNRYHKCSQQIKYNATSVANQTKQSPNQSTATEQFNQTNEQYRITQKPSKKSYQKSLQTCSNTPKQHNKNNCNTNSNQNINKQTTSNKTNHETDNKSLTNTIQNRSCETESDPTKITKAIPSPKHKHSQDPGLSNNQNQTTQLNKYNREETNKPSLTDEETEMDTSNQNPQNKKRKSSGMQKVSSEDDTQIKHMPTNVQNQDASHNTNSYGKLPAVEKKRKKATAENYFSPHNNKDKPDSEQYPPFCTDNLLQDSLPINIDISHEPGKNHTAVDNSATVNHIYEM